MSDSSLVDRPATQVVSDFAQGHYSPVDYLDACLDQITRINPSINALTAFDTDSARALAEQASERWSNGEPNGPLDGLPIGVKDLQETAGLLTTYGSPRMRANVPATDLPMVARLKQAGAIVLAKTNVPEYGAGGNTRNPVWGATGNPFDARLTVGGSSGGSAAALASHMLPLCTGSDTGGSLRLPAALCGVVGYRPSVDVIAHPTRPLGWSAISVLGPMARNVDDLLLMLRASLGSDRNDPLSFASNASRFDNLPPVRLDQLRVGISEDFGGAPVDASIRETFRRRVASIAPHVGECVSVDLDLGEMDRTFDILRAESFVAAFENVYRIAPLEFGEHIATNVALGLSMTLSDRAWAHAEQTRILRQFNARMNHVDVILLPTAPVSPFAWTQPYIDHIDGTTMDIYYRWLALTYRGSLMGGPSITLPSGTDPAGMPFGLQLLGSVKGDVGLLSIAKAFETLLSMTPETARAVPDLSKLTTSSVDLKSVVTHSPQFASVELRSAVAVRTAV